MTKLAILEYPDPRLRTKAAPVALVDAAVRRLADDLLETMYASRGIGLAATQVDVHRRLLVFDVSPEHNHPVVLINPQIVAREALQVCEEGCLSLPGIYANVERARQVRVRAQGRDGAPFELDAEGLMAICVQHELDHLDGRLFVDYLSELKRQLIRRRLAKERRQRSVGSEVRSPAPAI